VKPPYRIRGLAAQDRMTSIDVFIAVWNRHFPLRPHPSSRSFTRLTIILGERQAHVTRVGENDFSFLSFIGCGYGSMATWPFTSGAAWVGF